MDTTCRNRCSTLGKRGGELRQGRATRPSSTASTITRRMRRPQANIRAAGTSWCSHMDEARIVCDFIERGGDTAARKCVFCEGPRLRLRPRSGAGRGSPTRRRCSGQFSSSSRRQICGAPRRRRRGGTLPLIDTICSATQERQDAVIALLEPLDVMVVVGGYNSEQDRGAGASFQSRMPRRSIPLRRRLPSADRYEDRKYGPTGGCPVAPIGITCRASTAEQQDR